MLNDQQKRKVLDIIVSGKGLIPHEKINFIGSLSMKPENGVFFSIGDFCSTLKETAVGNDECY